MPVFALFGIENQALNTVVNLLALFLAVLWLALVFWTYKDAVRRISDPLLVACATATSLIFPFIGTIVYLILRPPEYIEDVRERELEIAAAEARLVQMHELACPYCAFPVERTFLRCPNCLKRLKEPCATCRKPLDPRWKICPYCEAEIRRGTQQRRRRPRTAPTGERPRAPAPSAQDRAPARVPARPQAAAAAGARSPARPAEENAQRPATRPADGRSTQRSRQPTGGGDNAQPRAPESEGAGADEQTVARPGSQG